MGKPRKGNIINCKGCGTEFYVAPYRVKTAKFCSTECQNHLQYAHKPLICQGCNKSFDVSMSRKNSKFCSLECKSIKAQTIKERRLKSKALTIESRGYITGRNLKKNLSLIKVLECEHCKYDEYSFCLEVHHKDENPNNNEINNLAILCVMCHRKLHKGIIKLENENAINKIA